ncbi:hypothetical protein RHSIM_Rhsim08G0215700 [Rhododendron simsii]|uniref:Uncharacterized protein n=1 Tax=Rhododendron simsii TaxID=118357 RepID=A0A834GLE9_RHOSS|nr:hypothetical protein RHSIM_Rhsim08G0215700 [Rhododendron simsii]
MSESGLRWFHCVQHLIAIVNGLPRFRFFLIHSMYLALGLHRRILIQKYEPSLENISEVVLLSSGGRSLVDACMLIWKKACTSSKFTVESICDLILHFASDDFHFAIPLKIPVSKLHFVQSLSLVYLAKFWSHSVYDLA